MDSSTRGAIAELITKAHFLVEGYNVYDQITGKEKHDMIIEKDGLLETVEVKSTTIIKNNSWFVKLRKTSGNNCRSMYDCDVLALYIVKEDRLVIKRGIKNRASISIKMEEEE
tara:strand:+ start:513 stop:851 length:339 start_codon:yes stop_codon:yes gene_type:complete